jgi:hypothetical protein
LDIRKDIIAGNAFMAFIVSAGEIIRGFTPRGGRQGAGSIGGWACYRGPEIVPFDSEFANGRESFS